MNYQINPLVEFPLFNSHVPLLLQNDLSQLPANLNDALYWLVPF